MAKVTEAIDSGAAARLLDNWITLSNELKAAD
jgi:hypothetical protein